MNQFGGYGVHKPTTNSPGSTIDNIREFRPSLPTCRCSVSRSGPGKTCGKASNDAPRRRWRRCPCPIATGDSAALEAYGGLNPVLQGTRILNAACAGSRRSTAAVTTGRTWRSMRVPSDLYRP